jgi:PIN domain nuclease of toxin-antitoxin system
VAVTVLDAYALVAFFAREKAGPEVRDLIHGGNVATTSVNLAESVDRLIRRGRERESVLRVAFELESSGVAVRVVDVPLAVRAASLRAKHYHRTRSPLSLADCICLAAAGPEDAIATADKPLLRAARAEGVEVVALPR